MHPNSLAAYREIRDRLSERKRFVAYAILAAYGTLTDREIAHKLGCRDMNEVRPRITELVQDPDVPIGEVGSVRDSTTGRTVRLVGFVPQAVTQETLF